MDEMNVVEFKVFLKMLLQIVKDSENKEDALKKLEELYELAQKKQTFIVAADESLKGKNWGGYLATASIIPQGKGKRECDYTNTLFQCKCSAITKVHNLLNRLLLRSLLSCQMKDS